MKSVKQELRDYLDTGYGICKGMSHTMCRGQSSTRRLQELVKDEHTKYCYMMADSKTAVGPPYKVWFKRIGSLTRVEPTGNGTFVLSGRVSQFIKVYSREFFSRKGALKALKACEG